MTALASLSLDLDDLWSYQKTHGDPAWEDHASYLEVLVPRVLALLAARGLTITVFLVGKDASIAANGPVLRSIAEAGHEIGNHSFRHEPWLHRYGEAELADEIRLAEEAIEDATGVRPVGFRGPGYSLSPTVLRVLALRGYRYDASTLPTVIGPLARAWYFRSARLSVQQRAERATLFGHFRDGLRPVRAYEWAIPDARLVEVPVTTMPLLRLPIHVSYLLTIASISVRLARAYFATALELCRRRRVQPSLLLHPLDFLGPDEAPQLSFFPGMGMPLGQKLSWVEGFIDDLAHGHRVTTILEQVTALEELDGLRNRDVATSAWTA